MILIGLDNSNINNGYSIWWKWSKNTDRIIILIEKIIYIFV